MIVVKVEHWENGDESKAEILGQLSFTNDGTGTKDVANYNVKFEHSFIKRAIPVITMFRIEGFRKEAGFWRLINMALTKMLKEVNRRNKRD